MIITHLGHACVLVETGGARILIDPGVFTPDLDQTSLDAILITHQHPDHLDPKRIKPLASANADAKIYCEPTTLAVLADAGVEGLALGEGEKADLGGGVTVTGIGHQHAEIFREIPRIGNVGMLLAADGEPSLLHPGDSYAMTPDGVDILAAPITAPWAALKETIDFVRAVKPGRVFPIHDAVVSQQGRGIYVSQLGNFLPDGAELQDLAGAGPTTF